MPRVEILHVVFSGGVPFAGASVGVYVRGGGPATVYQLETGPAQRPNPMVSDAYGRVEGWVDRGAYTVSVSGDGLAPYQVEFDAASGRQGAVDSGWLGPDVVTADKVATSGVNTDDIADGAVAVAAIGVGAIGASELAAGAVGTAELADGTVEQGNLDGTIRFGSGVFGVPRTVDPVALRAATGTAPYTRFARVQDSGPVTDLILYVAVQAGNVSVAVYDGSGSGRSAVPGNRARTSGTVACPAAGAAVVPVGASVTALDGQHWFAVSADSSTASFAVGLYNGSWTGALFNGLSGLQSAHPCPSTAAVSTWGNQTPCLVGA